MSRRVVVHKSLDLRRSLAHTDASMGVSDEASTAVPPPGPLYSLAGRAPARIRAPVQAALTRAATLPVLWPVVAALAVTAVALVLASRFRGLSARVAVSAGAECLVVVILVISCWDLLVRWWNLPVLTGPASQPSWPWVLRHVAPPFVLLAGVALGHFFWP